MKKVLISLFVLIIVFMIFSNSTNLTLNDVVNAFEQEGLTLKKGNLHPDNVFQTELNNTKPSTFMMNERTLTIYIFPSVRERKIGEKDFVFPLATVVEHKRYAVKNVLIFYVPNERQDTDVVAKVEKVIESL